RSIFRGEEYARRLTQTASRGNMAIFTKKPAPQPEVSTTATAHNLDFDLDVDTSVGRVPAATGHRAPANGSAPAYGIGDAIQLMRSLPTDGNADLVTRVVRVTLGSVNVRLEDIIE